MSTEKTQNDEKASLRKKAEENLKKKLAYLHKPEPLGKEKASEELWVHQIELEMQNEELQRTQIELEEARHKYAELFDFAPLGYFVLDENGFILEANLTGADMVGIQRSELINKPFSICLKKESYDIYYLNTQKTIHKKINKRCELKMVRKKDGGEFDAELVLSPIIHEPEKITSLRVAVIDITNRKKIEKELSISREELEKRVKEKTADLLQVVNLLRSEIEQRKRADDELQKRTKELEQSELKYRTLIEVSPNAVCVAVDDKVMFVNNTAVKILKAKNEDELKGKSIWQFIHPDSLNAIKNRIERFQSGKKEPEIAEVTLVRTDGTFVEAGGTAALLDYEGKSGVLIIFQDISTRKRQEAKLRRIKSRLIEAQRIAHLGNWDWDIENNTVWLSDESYRILGIEPKSFAGNFEALFKLVHPEERQLIKETTEKAAKECSSFDIEFRIIMPSGIQRFIHNRGETECIDDKAVRMVGTIQDITEQKKTENQIILSRQKLRTLAAKMEMIEEQERRRIASDLHDSVGQILAFATRELKFMRKNLPKKHADTLLEIANQLDQAVVQTRTLSFDLSPSILYDIGFEIAVEDMLEKFSHTRKIKCEFENDDKPKPLTTPLKVLLYRSVRELLMNIAKHAAAENVRISLIKVDGNIQVTVEDDGKGFDVNEIETSEKTKGFGLFNIRERIEHLGGSCKIESAKGKGTKTVLTVPLGIEALQ